MALMAMAGGSVLLIIVIMNIELIIFIAVGYFALQMFRTAISNIIKTIDGHEAQKDQTK